MKATPTTTNICPCCGAPMRVFEQPALMPGRAATQLADCPMPGCVLYAVTLTLGAHGNLSCEDRAAYATAQEGVAR